MVKIEDVESGKFAEGAYHFLMAEMPEQLKVLSEKLFEMMSDANDAVVLLTAKVAKSDMGISQHDATNLRNLQILEKRISLIRSSLNVTTGIVREF